MAENHIYQVVLYGLVAGLVGTGLGGVIAFFLPRLQANLFSGILGFAAGVMLVVIFLELVIESLAEAGYLFCISGLLLGMAVFYLLDWFLPHHHPVTSEKEGRDGLYLRKGLLLAAGIALHNLPEGIAIGSGYAASADTGIVLAVLLALHNIPEGLAVAVPLQAAGRRASGVGAAVLAGLPMGVGAWIGAMIGGVSPLFLAVALSFAAGAMLYIVCDELIPDAYNVGDSHAAIVGIGTGVMLGLLLTAI